MIARGDLGIECPMEELPIIQRRIVKQCIHLGKPVIVATQMLESMIQNPVPTRAEITDVANARFETDCIYASRYYGASCCQHAAPGSHLCLYPERKGLPSTGHVLGRMCNS